MMGIIGAIIWLVGVIELLTKSLLQLQKKPKTGLLVTI